jgi:hypothetical protein
MKQTKYICICIVALLVLTACSDYLDPWDNTLATEEKAFELTAYLNSMPTTAYSFLPAGFNSVGNSYMTSASDESEAVNDMEAIQLFNNGTWNKYNNPDDIWTNSYRGIRIANDYLQGTDTLTWIGLRYSNPTEYANRMIELTRNRGEMRFLRAMFYFELFKRYGEVPLLKYKVDLVDLDVANYPQVPIDSIIEFIVNECDIATRRGKYALTQAQIDTLLKHNDKVLPSPYRDTLAVYYANTGAFAGRQGRATVGSALALKAKALVYYASKQFNENNDLEKWKRAAKACKDVIDLQTIYPNFYKLSPTYDGLFQPTTWGVWNNEYLFARRFSAFNSFDAANYPISIPGGKTGTCPTAELVDAYEMSDGTPFDWNNPAHAANPYVGRDERLLKTIFTNNELFNNAIPLQMWVGGNAGPGMFHASKTGYYLKKYINQTLDLNTNKTAPKIWSVMRLSEFYLFYAEAMNEAYGPESDPEGFGLTALQALNTIRTRTAVGMPAIPSGLDAATLTEKIIHERRVELAFEDARYWDLRRWKIAEKYLNGDIHGIRIEKNDDESFTYIPNIKVETRVFDASKMYLYPIPQNEINKAAGVLIQNPNW